MESKYAQLSKRLTPWNSFMPFLSNIHSTSDPYFDDIRPYNDVEMQKTLSQWGFCESLKLPLSELLFSEKEKSSLDVLFAQLPSVKKVAEFQMIIAQLVTKVIEKTTLGVDITGLDELPKTEAFLFLSNHRDIVLDPTLVNYALASSGRVTARVAIGDNLVKHALIGDLMRANKSFLVKRGIQDKRTKLKELTKLSHFISLALKEGHSVWLAQREGRAKDGFDETEPAVLKMLQLSGKAIAREIMQKPLQANALESVNVVPTSISYEWNPCDRVFAQQRVDLNTKDDTQEMIQGILGFKGKVHVHFGSPVLAKTIADLQEQVNAQIRNHYWLFASNFIAYAYLHQMTISKLESVSYTASLLNQYRINRNQLYEAQERFEERTCDLEKTVKIELYQYYARPVEQRILT